MHRARRRTVGFVIASLSVATMARAEQDVPPPAAKDESPRGETTTAGPSSEPTPMNPAAQARYDQGLELYRQRDFRAAIAEFELGYGVEPRREFLFAEAQAYRLAGDCGRAVPLYQRFLATQPSAIQIDATRLGLERCAQRSAQPNIEVRAGFQPTTPVPLPPPPPPVPPRGPWWQDAWGMTAVGAGVVALGVGVGFVLASNRAWDAAQAQRPKFSPDFDRLSEDYVQRRWIGLAALTTGATLCGAGLVRFAWVRHRDRRDRIDGASSHAFSVEPLPHGAALSWKGSF
jgi:tetratricopeptide (TPR) repeat protein